MHFYCNENTKNNEDGVPCIEARLFATHALTVGIDSLVCVSTNEDVFDSPIETPTVNWSHGRLPSIIFRTVAKKAKARVDVQVSPKKVN